MFKPKIFIYRFFFGFILSFLIFFIYYLLVLKVGEVDIENVINRQTSHDSSETILFSSGINQSFFPYKSELMKINAPDVVALGSSRALEVRGKFIQGRFTNMGGVVSSIADLESYAKFITEFSPKPKLTLLFLDPWWFNRDFNSSHVVISREEFPKMISLDHFYRGIKLLNRGNWIIKSFQDNNLGIAALLTGDGFSIDGSYHYSGSISGKNISNDIKFVRTLDLIKNGDWVFKNGTEPDAALITRACDAIAEIKKNTYNIVLVAPPFPGPVWDQLKENPKFGYIKKAYIELQRCLSTNVYEYLSLDQIKGSNDCEFIDGIHGGDTVYARILLSIATNNHIVNSYVDREYLEAFVRDESGYAGGFTRHTLVGAKEIDFLKLGCDKSKNN